MKRLFLMTTTALALWVGAAIADDANTVFVEQLGQGNDIRITQLHDPDIQNSPSTNNVIGTEADPVRQEGSGNTMLLIQGQHSGGDDTMGTAGLGINQSGNTNYLGLFQLSGPNLINEVQQHGSGNTASAVQSSAGSTIELLHQYGDGNTAAIEQINSHGSIASLIQGTASGPAASNSTATIQQFTPGGSNVAVSFQTGDSNIASLHQTGSNGSIDSSQAGDLNETEVNAHGDNMLAVVSVEGLSNYVLLEQFSGDQSATIAFTGDGNRLITSQTGGTANSVIVDIQGNDNGTSTFSAGHAAEQTTQMTAVPDGQNRIMQSGNGNAVSVIALNADNNSFGLQQSGDGNSIVGSFITNGGAASTLGNEVAVFQGGNANHVNFAVSGIDNSLGIAQ